MENLAVFFRCALDSPDQRDRDCIALCQSRHQVTLHFAFRIVLRAFSSQSDVLCLAHNSIDKTDQPFVEIPYGKSSKFADADTLQALVGHINHYLAGVDGRDRSCIVAVIFSTHQIKREEWHRHPPSIRSAKQSQLQRRSLSKNTGASKQGEKTRVWDL